ncbi:MAG: HYR domain-containing protein, partial [Bacteroidales bacterium]|nr:HYR domain-containing protein [Bacteroidales bacterium]
MKKTITLPLRLMRSNASGFIAGLLLLIAGQAANAQLVSATSETLVNTSVTLNTQQNCAISMDTMGRYVVVWESDLQDGDGFGIYAKIYNADHTVRVPDFQVNTSTDANVNYQRFPDVAMNADGTFCVVWQSTEDEGYNTSWSQWVHQGWDVYRRIYDIDGNPSSRSRVNSATTGDQMHPAIAAGDDFFVVTYASEVAGTDEFEIYVSPFMAAGANVNSSQLVHTLANSHMTHPDVGMSTDNAYTITWQIDSLDGDRNGVYYASYDNSYNQIIAPTQVNTTTAGNQQEPRIAIDENGEFMIVWSSFGQDGDHYGIYGQRFLSPGNPSGGEIAITTNTTGSQDHAAIAVTREGGIYTISWTDDVADGDRSGIYSRSMLRNGSFLSAGELINTTTSDFQIFSDMALGTDSTQVVFAWQSGIRDGATAQTDPSYYGIYAEAFIIEDITPPNAVCQNINLYLDGTGNGTIVAADIDGGSTDNAGAVTLSASQTAFTCADLGPTNVTLTVTDGNSNTDNCVAVVTVLDTVSPVTTCPGNQLETPDASCNFTLPDYTGLVTATDNCSASPTVTQSPITGTVISGTTTITMTSDDGNGNTSTCQFDVIFNDAIPPTAVCQNINAYLDGAGSASIVAADIDGGSTDNCSGLTLSASQTAFTCADIGPNNVTLTATDGGSNTDNCVAVVTIIDTISPTAVCQNINAYLDGTGNVNIAATDIDGGSTDNCSTVNFTASITAFTCADLGANNVTLTVDDGNGNTANCVAIVTIIDTISPSAVCQNINAYLNGAGNASIVAADIDGGSTDNCATVNLSASITAFTCADLGANNVTLTADDGNGNTTSCVAVVTIIDTTSPSAVCQNINAYLDGAGNVSIVAADIDGGSTDNCSTVNLSASITAFTCADIGANNVTLTADDGNGNTANCVAVVTVIDTISPSAVCQNINAYLDGTGNASIVAADLDGGSTDNCATVNFTASITAFTCADLGANNVTLTAEDGSGNTAACVAVVTVIDTTSPSAVCQNINLYLDGAGNGTIVATDIDGGSTDNCGSVSLSASITVFTCADLGPNNVTLTADDGNGNTNNCIAVVTIVDTISPVTTCPGNQIENPDAACNFTLPDYTGLVTASDNCNPAPTVTQSPVAGTVISGTTTLTMTSDDGNGNTSFCTFNVSLNDVTPPTAVCQNINVYLDGAGNASIIAADIDGGSSDNCSGLTFSASQAAFTCADLGPNNVTLIVTDGNANSSNCVAVVTVIDTISPSAVCQNINAYLDGAGNVSIFAADIDGGSTDNCGVVTLSASTTGFTCADIGANNVTLTADDGNGNTANCVAVVTVIDTISPGAVCQNINTYLDGTGNASIVAADLDGGSTDNCGTVNFTASTTDFTCADLGTNNVTLSTDDGNGNTATCVAIVTVIDTISPSAVCQNINAYIDGAGNVSIVAADIDGGSTDNCGGVTLSASATAFTCADLGSNNVTLTADDGNGNTNNCIAVVTVIDTISPSVTCPGNQTENGDANCQFILPDYTSLVTGADNCTPSPTISQSPISGTVISGITTIIMTADDENGNTATCTFTVTVVDNISPTFTAPNNITIYRDALCNYDASVSETGDVVNEADNCGVGQATFVDQVNTSVSCSVIITRTWSLSDNEGNAAADQIQIITVEDNTPPSFTAPGNLTIYKDANCIYDASIAATGDVTDEADNCEVGEATYSDAVDDTDPCVIIITRTWSLTDDCGNVAADQVQTITVNDNTLPTFTKPADITIYKDADCDYNAAVSITGDVSDEAD